MSQTEECVEACVSTVKSVSIDCSTGNRFYLLNSELMSYSLDEQNYYPEKDLCYAPKTPVAFDATIYGKNENMKGEVLFCSSLSQGTLSNDEPHSLKSYTVLVQLEKGIRLFHGIDENCIQYLRTEEVEPTHQEHDQTQEETVEMRKSTSTQTEAVTVVQPLKPFQLLASLAREALHEDPSVLMTIRTATRFSCATMFH
jgi:hypothetical protein